MATIAKQQENPQAKFRLARVKLAAVWSIAAKLSSLAVTVISIPMAIDTLGAERFGIWIAVTTFFSMFGVLDGGISNAVINLVVDQHAAKNQHRLTEIVSSAYFLMSLIALLGSLLAVVLSLTVDWRWALSLPEAIPNSEVIQASLVVGLLFFTNFPLSLSSRIRQGLQESHLNSLFEVSSSLYILIGTTICWLYGGTLLAFLLVFASGPVLACTFNSGLLWLRRDVDLAPRLYFVSQHTAVTLLTTGSLFLGLQICAALAFQTDVLIVSKLIGLEAAAELGVVNRVFLIASTLTGMFIAPLWPAFRDAATKGDADWIRHTFHKTLAYSLAVSLAVTAPLACLHAPLIKAWIGTEITPTTNLVTAAFVWANMSVVGNLLAVLLNGLNVIRLQLVLSMAMTILNLLLSLALTLYIGTPGVVWGSIISYTICIVIPYFLLYPQIIADHTITQKPNVTSHDPVLPCK